MERDLWQLVEAYRDAWVAHDLDGLMELVTPDVVFHNHTAGERIEGADAFRERDAGIHARWPDTRFEERAVHLGDDFAVVEWTATATRGNRRRIEWDGIDVIELHGRRVRRDAVYSSSHAPRLV